MPPARVGCGIGGDGLWALAAHARLTLPADRVPARVQGPQAAAHACVGTSCGDETRILEGGGAGGRLRRRRRPTALARVRHRRKAGHWAAVGGAACQALGRVDVCRSDGVHTDKTTGSGACRTGDERPSPRGECNSWRQSSVRRTWQRPDKQHVDCAALVHWMKGDRPAFWALGRWLRLAPSGRNAGSGNEPKPGLNPRSLTVAALAPSCAGHVLRHLQDPAEERARGVRCLGRWLAQERLQRWGLTGWPGRWSGGSACRRRPGQRRRLGQPLRRLLAPCPHRAEAPDCDYCREGCTCGTQCSCEPQQLAHMPQPPRGRQPTLRLPVGCCRRLLVHLPRLPGRAGQGCQPRQGIGGWRGCLLRAAAAAPGNPPIPTAVCHAGRRCGRHQHNPSQPAAPGAPCPGGHGMSRCPRRA